MSRGAVLAVVAPGASTLIVDRGRPGYRHLGVAQGGAADPELYGAALLCAGAAPGAAALELTLTGPLLECRAAPCRLAIAGDCAAEVVGTSGERPIPGWTAVDLEPGERLRCRAVRGGARAYLAVAGGVDVEPQLGSRSTSLRGAAAGLLGRPLRRGDELAVGDAQSPGPPSTLGPPAWLLAKGPLRVCPGPQESVLAGGGASDLLATTWRVSPDSDRAGVRLEGPALPLRAAADVASQGCPPGAIQVGGDGLPIVLGCERGTTGGYAVVATVASVDLPRLGRLRPGDDLCFAGVTVEEARALRRERAALIATLSEHLVTAP